MIDLSKLSYDELLELKYDISLHLAQIEPKVPDFHIKHSIQVEKKSYVSPELTPILEIKLSVIELPRC